MRGKVEVYAIAADGSHSLVAEGSNLVVNGAGESVVDMLTTPSSVLGIAPRVMDTSNFRMAAISFGPAASSFQENGYFFPKDAIWYKTDDLCHGVSSNVSSLINLIGTDKRMRVMWTSATYLGGTGEASAYTPPYRLPSYPDPMDTKLEDANTAYSIVSGDGTQSYGHFENRIQFNPTDASSYFQGVYPSRTTDSTQGALVSSYEGDFTTYTNLIASTVDSDAVEGDFNIKYYMDYRGFCHLRYDTTVGDPVLVGRTSVSAAQSFAEPLGMVVDSRVTYSVNIGKWDVWAMNNYGGLHQIGLWTMDCKKALENNQPPFLEGNPIASNPKFIDTGSGSTKQEFKLFAKKTFTENLCANKDDIEGDEAEAGFTHSKDLYIQWTLDFRSQHD